MHYDKLLNRKFIEFETVTIGSIKISIDVQIQNQLQVLIQKVVIFAFKKSIF